MSKIYSREIRLVSYPIGLPTNANFAMAEVQLESPQKDQVLVKNLYMSVDPYMRGRMNDETSYVPPFELGKTMDGGAIGQVVESKVNEFKPGDLVASNFGWREQFLASATDLQILSSKYQPTSVYLGALGMTGMTAWSGLKLVGLKTGDTVFISGAAGAVGNMAGQLAKIYGCRVIGSVGSGKKVSFLKEKCGFDAAFNYNEGDTEEELKQIAPDGIDVYFDNVGGPTLEAALSTLRLHGRIISCGAISSYNNKKKQPGPSNMFNFITKRLTMSGFIVRDWIARQPEFENEVGSYFLEGKIKNHETIVEGIDNAVGAFLGLFEGKNIGKMIVKLSR